MSTEKGPRPKIYFGLLSFGHKLLQLSMRLFFTIISRFTVVSVPFKVIVPKTNQLTCHSYWRPVREARGHPVCVVRAAGCDEICGRWVSRLVVGHVSLLRGSTVTRSRSRAACRHTFVMQSHTPVNTWNGLLSARGGLLTSLF